jgi:hypothetical protein
MIERSGTDGDAVNATRPLAPFFSSPLVTLTTRLGDEEMPLSKSPKVAYATTPWKQSTKHYCAHCRRCLGSVKSSQDDKIPLSYMHGCTLQVMSKYPGPSNTAPIPPMYGARPFANEAICTQPCRYCHPHCALLVVTTYKSGRVQGVDDRAWHCC